MGRWQRAIAIVAIWAATGWGWFALFGQLFLTRLPPVLVAGLTAILPLAALGGTALVLRASPG